MRTATFAWLALVALCLTTPAVAQAQELDQLISSDTMFFARIENLDRTRERFEKSPLRAMWDDPAVAAFLKKPLEQWSKLMDEDKAESGLNVEEVLAVLSGSVSVAITGLDMPPADSEASPEPRVLMMADLGENVERARELIESTEETMVEKFRRFEEEFRGVTIVYLLPVNDDHSAKGLNEPTACYVLDGSTFLLATKLEDMRQVIAARDADSEESLANSELYRKMRARTGEQGDVFVYMGMKPLLAAMAKTVDGPDGEDGEAEFKRIFDGLGMGAMEAAAAQMRVGREGILTRMFLSAPGPKAGIMKILDGANSALTPPAFVPAEVTQASVMSLDIPGIWAEVFKVAESIQPGSTQMIKMTLEQMKAQTGIDFEADVIGSLGKEVAWYTPAKEKAPELDVNTGIMAAAMPQGVITVELTDKAKMEGVLNIAQMLTGGAMQIEDYLGWRIRTIQMGMPTTPAIVLMPDRLAFAMNVEDLHDIIRRQGKEVKGVNDLPEFARAMEYAPANRFFISFAQEAKSLHQSALLSSLNLADDSKEYVDMSLFPAEEVLAKYLGVGVTTMTNEEDGVSYVYFHAFPTSDSEEED
jgi:hypothetical protein